MSNIVKSYPLVQISNLWENLNELLGIPIGTPLLISVTSSQGGYLFVGTDAPTKDVEGFVLEGLFGTRTAVNVGVTTSPIWVRGGMRLNVHEVKEDSISGALSGTQAITIQTYDESNKKAGVQYAASRFLSMTQGQYVYSIIKTGDKPVDLKKREFAYTGNGLVAYMFKNPTYTGGTLDSIRNMTDINPVPSGIELIAGITIPTPTTLPTHTGANAPLEWGEIFAEPTYAIGPQTNQTTGSVNQAYASNRILAPNTEYLLVIYSRSTQEVSPRLEWYEGELDRVGGGLGL